MSMEMQVDYTDLDKMVAQIEGSMADKERSLQEITNKDLANALLRAVSLIDVYRTAREAGDESADMYLENSRRLLLALMGIS